MRNLLFAGLFALLAAFGSAAPARANDISVPCLSVDGAQPACNFVSNSNPLPVAGTFSASLSGFTPGGSFATLTATGASASVALPAGTTVFFQNTGTTTVSCTLGVGSATAIANEIQVPAGAGVPVVVGSNTFGACIDQTGSASNLVVLAGGSGLATPYGGASSGGGSSSITSWAGGTLGSMANYGTSPGAVLVPGINAFVTNTVPVSAASLPLPALAATSTKQSDGTQKTQIVDGSGNVIGSTSNNLNIQCANCSGSGASATDEAAFTAGASVLAPGGGFFQTTATNNPLTTGQQGMWQMTAQRAGFVNLRNASGTEIGTASTPVQVSAASGAVASGAYASGAVSSGAYASGSLASGAVVDLTNAQTPVAAGAATATKGLLLGGQFDTTQKTLTNGQQATLSVSSRGALFVATGADAFSVTANAGTNLNTSALALESGGNLATIAGAITASKMQENIAQVNGVTTLAGAGAVGTGAQRVAVGQDTTTIAGSAPGTAGTASANVVTVQGIASMTKLLVTPDSVALPANQSVNVAQVGGTTTDTNAGNKSAGTQRVVLASDQTAADPCMFQAKTNVAVSTATGTTALVTGVSAKKIYVCSILLVAPSAVSVSLSEGSSSTCGTSAQAAVIGVATNGTAANGVPLAANTGWTLGNGGGTVAATATNANYLCLFQSGTAQIAGNLTYVQQ